MIGLKVLVLFKIFLEISATTHWVVTENGRIQAQLDSMYHMHRPDDLVAFLGQSVRAAEVERLYRVMAERKASFDLEWSQLESASELENHLYATESDCLLAGRPLSDKDLYISIYDAACDINLDEVSPAEVHEEDDAIPDCSNFAKLNFSMATFPHLPVLSQQWNMSLEVWTGKPSHGLRTGRQLASGLQANASSWYLHNLSTLHWLRAGNNTRRALDCAKRALHFAPRQHRDVALLNLGLMLQQARCPAEAAILLHAAIDHAPHKPTSHFVLGNVYAILGDYNRSAACYSNALRLLPSWPIAERNRFAVLCHHKLENALYKLHGSLQGILKQLHDYHQLQESWLKLQEELIQQQAPLELKLQGLHHESFTSLLSRRSGESCVPHVDEDDTVVSCDNQLLAHHLQIDITLSLQLLLKNVETQAREINEQMTRRLSGSLSNPAGELFEPNSDPEESGLEIFLEDFESEEVAPSSHDDSIDDRLTNLIEEKMKQGLLSSDDYYVLGQQKFENHANGEDCKSSQHIAGGGWPQSDEKLKQELKQFKGDGESPKCINPSPHPVPELSEAVLASISPEPRLLPVLAILVEMQDTSLSDIAALLAHILARRGSWAVAMAAAIYWRLLGKAEHVVTCLQQAVQAAPSANKDSPLRDMAALLMKLGHNNEALLLASLALQIAPSSWFNHLTLYRIHSNMGDKKNAALFGRSASFLKEKTKVEFNVEDWELSALTSEL